MSQVIIKCANTEHINNVKLVCFDEFCKADRLYCMQCNRNGTHVSHPQHQYELPILFDHIEQIQRKTDQLIDQLNIQMDLVYQSFYQLIRNIRIKYQITRSEFLKLNPKQMNSIFFESLQFEQFNQVFLKQFLNSSQVFKDQLIKLNSDLNLNQLNYYQQSKNDIIKSKELYQQGYNLYLNESNYQEAIKIFDQAISFNPKNYQALWCKGENLRMLSKYNEALIYADKALEINSQHQNSLYLKSACFRRLCQYEEAIIWADKALKINPKDCPSLACKGNALRLLKMLKEASEIIDYSLKINPNHIGSLETKGVILQDQNRYEEALIYFDKVLSINQKNLWVQERKKECLDSLIQP
ncbi:unnamed protein product [Paramecium sonneborni]|uniref:Tetratricopeptide repeat protein n=1 Tax=Paramecium sonneborni TaxID=65129 RepID=A0A8S1ND52_9CILI|nr:unnamed protein product [Paramecium sonneborni]